MYLVIWCREIEKLRWIDGLKKNHREILKGEDFEEDFAGLVNCEHVEYSRVVIKAYRNVIL